MGVIDQSNGFEEFTGALFYEQSTPWTTHGITYTSAYNIVLGPGVGLGVQSNSITTDFGAAVTGELPASDAVTLFGADLTLIGVKVPVSVVVSTNLGSYTFADLDVPLATTGRRFFGIALARAGEYVTGFRFSIGGSTSTGLLVDDVAVGHVDARNADPEASVGGPYSGSEGSAVSFALGATDADSDELTFAWDLGDGTVGTGSTPPANHVYADDGSYPLMLAVSDGRGGVDTARTTVTVSNVAPALQAFSVPTTPVGMTSSGVTIPVSAGFTDPGTLDSHIATIECGNESSAGVDAPNGIASGSCTFAEAGVYVIRITIRDDDGGMDTKVASGKVVVFDPRGAWVTGGGWVGSPEEAYAVAMTITGKLSFNIAARYASAASTSPTGSVELKLNTAKAEFRSTALEWLVVAGRTAQIRGRGTMNGTGDYGFAIVASDNDSDDRIRVRIWQRTSGAMIYNNFPNATLDTDSLMPLGGGSIQIHQK